MRVVVTSVLVLMTILAVVNSTDVRQTINATSKETIRDYVTRPWPATYDPEYAVDEELLRFIDDNIMYYGDEFSQSCLDEAGVKDLMDGETERLKRQFNRLFVVTVSLFSLNFVMCVIAVTLACRRRRERRQKRDVIKYNKPFIDDSSDNTGVFPEASNAAFDQVSEQCSPQYGGKATRVYSVEV
ncbi:uncharacterized protein LOC143470603 [Clavelina lepadiformis]|uniref:Uncharacterized protein n=1 Tax=Clavelina lepadiformis TaxID=159417 RepID=A0ABP0FIC1_CLALP